MGRHFEWQPEEGEVPLQDKPITEIASVLQAELGQKLVAHVVEIEDGTLIGKYARGELAPSESVESTLRDFAYVTETLLRQEGSGGVVRALMIGMNPNLNDRSIVEMFHAGEGSRVVAVADKLGPE